MRARPYRSMCHLITASKNNRKKGVGDQFPSAYFLYILKKKLSTFSIRNKRLKSASMQSPTSRSGLCIIITGSVKPTDYHIKISKGI